MYLLNRENIEVSSIKTEKNSNSPPNNLNVEFDKEKKLPSLLKGSKRVREYFKNIK